jgi:hypothetical protein
MLYSEIIALCSVVQTEDTNKLGGQNVGFLNVRSGDTYSKH